MSKINLQKPINEVEESAKAIESLLTGTNQVKEFNENLNDIVTKFSQNPWALQKTVDKNVAAKAKKAAEVNKDITEKILKTNILSKLAEKSDILNRSLKKISTSTDIMNLAIDINKINNININNNGRNQVSSPQEIHSVMERMESIIKNGGMILDYDLETLGGTNSAGHNQVDFITELAFNVRSVISGGPDKKDFFDTKKYEADKKALKIEELRKMKKPSMGHKSAEVIAREEAEWKKRCEILKKFDNTDYTDKKKYKKAKLDFDKNGKYKDVDNYKTVLGFDEDEYKTIKKMLNNSNSKWSLGQVSDKERLYIERLSMMSQEGIELSINKDVFEVNIEATGIKHDANVERALKGLEVMRDIGKHQEEIANKAGMTLKEKKNSIITEFQELVTTGKNAHFGIDLTSGQLGSQGVVTGHNILGFDMNALEQITSKKIAQAKGVVLDTFEVFKYIENNLGKGRHLPKSLNGITGPKKILRNGIWQAKAFGIKTMDFINHSLGIIEEGKEAHNAFIDVINHTNAFFNSYDGKDNLFSHIAAQVNKIKGKKNINPVNIDDGIFLLNEGGTTVNGEKNIFSFSLNRTNDEIKFTDGSILNRNVDNTLEHDSVEQYVGKKNTLYKTKMYEVKVDSEEFNNLIESVQDGDEKFFNRLKGTDTLYVQELEEWMSEDVAKELGIDMNNRPVSFRISTNKDELTSQMQKITTNGTVEEKAIVGKMIQKDGKFEFSKSENVIDDLSKETGANSFDSVNRKVRDVKAPLLKQYANITNNNLSHAEMVSRLVTERNLAGEALKNISSGTMDILDARKGYDIATDNLYQFAGYTFNGRKYMAQGAVEQAGYIDNVINGINPALDKFKEIGLLDMDNMFEYGEANGMKMVKGINYKSGINIRKNQAVMGLLIDELEDLAINGNIDEISELARDMTMPSDKWAMIDIAKNDIDRVKKIRLGRDGANNYHSISLDSENSVLRTFFNAKFEGNEFANIDGSEGYSSLIEAIEYFSSNKEYGRKAIGKMSIDRINEGIENGISVKALGAELQNNLKNFVMQKDKDGNYIRLGKGLKYRRADVDFSSKKAANIWNKFLSNSDNLNSVIEKVTKKLSKNELEFGRDANQKELINQIYSKMMFDEEKFVKDITDFSDEYKNSALMHLKAAKKDSMNMAEKIAKSIVDGDMQTIINESGIYIGSNNEFRLVNIHEYKNNGGIITSKVGNGNYNMELSLKLNETYNKIKNYDTAVSLDNLGKAIDVTSTNELARSKSMDPLVAVRRAVENGDDPIDALIRAVNKGNKNIIDSSSMIEHQNFTNLLPNNNRINMKEIFKILPELEESMKDKLSKATAGNDGGKTASHIKLIEDAVKSMKETASTRMRKGYKFVREGLEGAAMQTENKTAFYRSFHDIIMDSIRKIGGDTEEVEVGGKKIKFKNPLRNISLTVKSTATEHELASLVKEVANDTNASYENHMRDPVYQGSNTVNYDKKKASKELSKIKQMKGYENSYVKLDRKTYKGMAAAYTTQVMKDEVGADAVVKMGQMTNVRAMIMLESEITSALNGETNNVFYEQVVKINPTGSLEENKEKAKFLAEKAKHISTYEQEGYMNSRIARQIADGGHVKTISGGKLMSSNPKASKGFKAKDLVPFIGEDGTFKYQQGKIVGRKELLGEFGEDGIEQYSRNKGIFKARMYDKITGLEISEKKINEHIANNGINTLDQESTFKALMEQFDFKYKVFDLEESGGKKIMFDATEKATMFYGTTGLGRIDNTIVDELLDTGLFDDMGLKKDLTLSVAAVDEMKERMQRSGMAKEQINELIARVENEINVFGDAIQNTEFFENTGIVGLISVNKAKHISVSSPLADIQAYAEDILTDDELVNFTKALYNTDEVSMKNGKVIVNNENEINFKGKKFTDFLSTIDDDKRKRIEFAINDKKLVNNSGAWTSGEDAIGTVIHTRIAQIRDDESGIIATKNEMIDITRRRTTLEQSLKEVNEKLKKKPKDVDLLAQRNALAKSWKDLEIDERMLKSEKGLKFTERMNLNLSMEAWNNNLIENIEGSLENDHQKTMFEKAFGHALTDSGVVKQEYDGKSFLDKTLERTRSLALFGHGETSLAHAINESHDYDYLKEAFKGVMDWNDISVEKAEQIYAYKAGLKAADLNANGITEDTIKEMQEKGWTYIDMNKESLTLDVGGQGKVAINTAGNPYSNNVIIKTGDEVFAMGRMPDRVFEDSVIKDEQRKLLGGIQRKQAELNELRSVEVYDPLEEERLLISLREKKEDLVNLQKKDVTSKGGLAGKIHSTRLAMTFAGKGKGLITDEQWLNISQNEENILKRAKFMGESITDHISNGFYMDATFISKEAFDNMGYYDEDNMKNFFGKMKNSEMLDTAFGKTSIDVSKMSVDEMEEGMTKILQTYGDAAFATRFPNIQLDSDKIAMVYLDEHLEKNQIMTLSHTGMSAKLDHDGDNFFISMMTGKKRGTDTYLHHMAQANGDTEFVKEVNSFMSKKAFTSNRTWADEVRFKEQKMDEMNLKGADFETIAKKRLIDDSLLPRYTPNEGTTITDMIGNIESFNDKYYGALDDAKNSGSPGKGIDEWLSKSYDGKISNREFVENSGTSIDDFKTEFANVFYGSLYMDEQVAKTSKGSVGATNVTNFKARMQSLMALDKTDANYEYKKNSLVEMLYQAEEAVISSKSAVSTLSRADRAKVWNQNIDKIMSGNSTADDAKSMVNWLTENTANDVKMHSLWTSDLDGGTFRNIAREIIADKTDDEIYEILKNNSDERTRSVFNRVATDTVSMLQSLGENPNAKYVYNSLRKGMSTQGTINFLKNDMFLEDTISEEIAGVVNRINVEGAEDIKSRKASLTIDNSVTSMRREFENSQTETPSLRQAADSIIEGAENLIKGSSSPKSGLAMGVMGLATGVLISGFVGGRPRPADVQAMEEAQQAYTPMDGPLALADPGMASGQGPGGYVVNINARTNGDQKRAAQAIQQALGKGMGANVNVTMNIGNDYSNINNRDIEKAVLATLE